MATMMIHIFTILAFICVVNRYLGTDRLAGDDPKAAYPRTSIMTLSKPGRAYVSTIEVSSYTAIAFSFLLALVHGAGVLTRSLQFAISYDHQHLQDH